MLLPRSSMLVRERDATEEEVLLNEPLEFPLVPASALVRTVEDALPYLLAVLKEPLFRELL